MPLKSISELSFEMNNLWCLETLRVELGHFFGVISEFVTPRSANAKVFVMLLRWHWKKIFIFIINESNEKQISDNAKKSLTVNWYQIKK